VKEALIAYVTRAGEKLRRDRLLARHMQVFIHNSPFDRHEPYFSNSTGYQLLQPTNDTAELIRHACHALTRIFRPGIHYAKCGLMLTELVAEGTEQRDLFDTRDGDRRQRLMTALDTINRRMGRDTVFYAGSGIRRDWAAFANMKTQAFSTDWRQMMQVRV
jgi:DNA polymerase V